MKLEIGMYVRTKEGITQFKEYDTSNGKLLCMPLMNGTFANIEDILKASNNIIDLIEVGDYVNGKLIHKIQIKNDGTKLLEYGNGNHIKIIKEILTHEQYNSNKYVIGDE